MIKYKISANLYFSKYSQLSLEKPLFYRYDKLRVSIKNNAKKEDRLLDVSLELDTVNENSASIIIKGELELERVSNLISWFYDVPILKWKINKITSNIGSKMVSQTNLTKQLSYSVAHRLDNKKIKNLTKQLTQNYHSNFEDTLMMWREALSGNGKAIKYILFYRILEKLCGDSKIIDDFIKNKAKEDAKEVKIIKDRGKEKTIFTFIRDNIHPKCPKFPYDLIEQYLPQIQNLAKKKIQECFPLNN